MSHSIFICVLLPAVSFKYFNDPVNVEVKSTLQKAMQAQRGSGYKALHFP